MKEYIKKEMECMEVTHTTRATTNYVKFAGKCWRIIRINGDKTMRLIYDGATCHANGTSTTDSIAVA